MSNTKCFADLIKVCSVLPALLVMPAMGANYTKVDETPMNGVLTMSGEYSWMDASTADDELSVWWIKGGHVTVQENTKFTNNKADVGIFSVSAKAPSYLTLNSGVVFENNVARFDGGAVANYDVLVATDVTFRKNVAQIDFDKDTTPMGGGAIALGAVSNTKIYDSHFIQNESKYHGGAIAMRGPNDGDNSQATLDIFDTDFSGNLAGENGGAIYSTFYDSVTERYAVYMNDVDFERNSAQRGGAVYNDGLADRAGNKASMKIVDADFDYNSATVDGGAIYNAGAMVIADTDFVGNTATALGGAIYSSGKLDLDRVNFISNSVIEEDGGALFITGGQENNITNSIFRDNHADNYSGGAILLKNGVLNIDNTTFVGNTAMESGAIFTYSSQPNTLNITNSVFDGNMALSAGAVQAMNIANISNTVFKNNIATTNSDGAGALFVGAVGRAVLDNVTFVNNSADYRGGAISTRSADLGNNKDAKLDILDSVFTGNIAGTTGGAFDNYLYSSKTDDTAVYFENATFASNNAEMGGAIYNHGAKDLGGNTASLKVNGATFVGNIATQDGGAIYNEDNGGMTLEGTNTFTANTANGFANDIYNDGMLTIASGVTSIDGGITGAGTLDIKSGATLNMNYASIEQGSINIDGTLMASILNANDAVDISGMLSGSGNLLLNVGAIGTYDLGELKSFVTQDSFGKVYNVSLDENNVATLTAKDAATIAQDTGITNGAAGAVSALATSGDVKLQKVSLAVQEALNTGNAEVVEQEMAKVNPNKKPVGQSVSSSVQNQVLSLASGRMSAVGGGATGRAGGDVTGAGVWAQGIVNKSKMGSQFEGHSAGFAMGGDTLIDNVLTLGGGYAFSDTDILGGGRDIDVESNSIFVYGQYKPAKWYVNATLTYTESEYTDVANVMGVALQGQEYDIKAYGAQAMFGYDFASGVTPEFGLRYLHTAQEEHLNSLGATVQDLDVNFLSGVAGLKYAFEIESDTAVKFSPTMRAAMTYDFLSEDAQATVVFPGATPYYVDVDSLSRMGGEFGIGLTAEWRGLELSLDYELVLHKDYTSQTGLFKFRYNF